VKKLWAWLLARRKYLGAALIVLAVLAGVLMGKLDAALAATILVLAAQMAGLGNKVERHTAQVTAVLTDLAKAGVSVTVHNYSGAEKSAIKAAQDGIKLAESIQADRATGETAKS
jgi:hypothetical protein